MKSATEIQTQEGEHAMKKGLSIQEKLKDLRVVEKGFTLKQESLHPLWGAMKATITKTSAIQIW